MKTIRFLLLANSAKKGEHSSGPTSCIAGVDLDTKTFVRLVADDKGEPLDYEIFDKHRPGSVFEVQLHHKAPTLGAQTENWVLASQHPVYLYQVTEDGWPNEYVNDSKPFGDVYPYFYPGNYRKKNYSLSVIKASDIDVYEVEGSEGAKTKVDFTVTRHDQYLGEIQSRIRNMSMTDYKFRNGSWKIKEAFLVVSLPPKPVANDRYYKFVAAIIPTGRAQEIDTSPDPEQKDISEFLKELFGE